MSFGKGYVQVYTGNGKGKTTAAIGLAIRALGAGKRILFLQFMKAKTYNEHNILSDLSPRLTVETLGKPFFIAWKGACHPETLAQIPENCFFFEPGHPPADYVLLVKKGLERAGEAVSTGVYDLVVLDEINVALHFELLSIDEVLDLIDRRAAGVEIVLTGRYAPQALMDRADLVTEMREVKHYYAAQGVRARKGIEN